MNATQSEHPVYAAIEIGELAETRKALGATAPDEPRNAWNATPLIMAAWHGRLQIVKYLLEEGADINASYDAGSSALIVAAWHGHAPVVKYLLAAGADLGHKNRGGDDALVWASEHGHTDIVQELLDAGAKSVDAALVFACENGHRAIADELVRRGASLDYQHGDFNLTPLAAAAYRGHVELVDFLLAHGADVNAADDAALGWACGSQQIETSEMLIAHGANVNGRGAEGKTFLEEALDEGRTAVAELLRAHEARE